MGAHVPNFFKSGGWLSVDGSHPSPVPVISTHTAAESVVQ